jgi:hypothetical protein
MKTFLVVAAVGIGALLSSPKFLHHTSLVHQRTALLVVVGAAVAAQLAVIVLIRKARSGAQQRRSQRPSYPTYQQRSRRGF